MNGILQICLILNSLYSIRTEHFRSHHDLKKLLTTDEKVVKALESYVEDEKNRVNELERWFKEYKTIYTASLQDRDLINPVNVFLLIRRLTISVDEITSRILSYKVATEGVETIFQQMKANLSFPTNDDYIGAMDGIIRLQDTYEMSASDISKGPVTNITSAAKLSANDCVALGSRAYATHFYDLAIEWMTEALLTLEDDEKGKNTNDANNILPLIYEKLSQSYEIEGDARRAFEWNQKLLTLDPSHKFANEKRSILQEMAKDSVDEEFAPRRVRRYPRLYEYSRYKMACRGELSPSASILSQLKCRYASPSPFTRLARLKQEEAYLRPRVLIYRDVLNDVEAQVIKNLSQSDFLHTAEEDYRVAKWSWLNDQDHELVRRVTKRVEDMTGYTMDTAEQFTVINYGIGGHYEPHFDYFENEVDNGFGNGNRIATALFYMSNVSRGGGTAFPFLNLTVWPEKGSALVWWNLHVDGRGNNLTQHASCPVLVGTKWVINKWIHAHGQELINPCGLCEADLQDENALKRLNLNG